METVCLNVILQKLKEKEERDSAHVKLIKKHETVIKVEEDNIKQSETLRVKLTGELKKKSLENTKKEGAQELLQQTKLIWTDLLEKVCQELKEEEAKRSALQQSLYSNRIAFCGRTRECLDMNDFSMINCGFVNNNLPLPFSYATVIKTEVDNDEYTNLLESIKNLENQLEEFKLQEAQLEEFKQMKELLLHKPYCGEDFIKLQKMLKDIKDDLTNVDLEIETVNSDINQKELLILNRGKRNLENLLNLNVQGETQHSQGQSNTEVNNQNTEKAASSLKVVKFNDDVKMKCISPCTQKNTNNILKTKCITARTQNPSLRRTLFQQITSKLDGETQHSQEQSNTEAMTIKNTEKAASSPKVVKLNDSVKRNCTSVCTQNNDNSILKTRCITARTQSASLRRKMFHQIDSKLDGEMQDILFKKND